MFQLHEQDGSISEKMILWNVDSELAKELKEKAEISQQAAANQIGGAPKIVQDIIEIVKPYTKDLQAKQLRERFLNN